MAKNKIVELLTDVAAKVSSMAVTMPGISKRAASELGPRVADLLASDWGGLNLYIPRNLAVNLERRNAEIYGAFTGDNVQDLALKYRVSEHHIYAIIRGERARRQAQA